MKKLFTGAFALLFFAASCSDDDPGKSGRPAGELITPRVSAQVADPLNRNPFTGILEIYPCKDASPVYFGNYVNGKVTVFNGHYTIVDGEIFGAYNRELHLPIGDYNMIYWGTPKYEEPIYNSPAIIHPGVELGADLSKRYFSLRPNADGTFMPVYDLVHAVKPAHIGSEDLQTSLTRVTAGLKLIVREADNSVFPASIAGIRVRIGNIAEKMDFYTAETENPTKTVQFELTRSADQTTMGNVTVMLFPSAPNPPLELIVALGDGSEYKLSKSLGSTLSPNTRLTLDIVLGKILPEGDPGGFTIENWNEQSETIEFPIID